MRGRFQTILGFAISKMDEVKRKTDSCGCEAGARGLSSEEGRHKPGVGALSRKGVASWSLPRTPVPTPVTLTSNCLAPRPDTVGQFTDLSQTPCSVGIAAVPISQMRAEAKRRKAICA